LYPTRIDYARLNHEAPAEGTTWLIPVAEGVVWAVRTRAIGFETGLVIEVSPAIAAEAISLSLDGDDAYLVSLNGDEHVVRIDRSATSREGGNLVSHRIELPESRDIVSVRVEPLEGDGYYGLGHLLIEERD